MTTPIATAHVDILASTGNFAAELQRAIRDALSGVSSAVNHMTTQINGSLNQVGTSTSRSLNGVGNNSQAAATKVGGSFKKMAIAGAGLFAGVQLGQVFTGFIKDAAESAKVARLTANVIRSTGGAAKVTADQVGDLATAISNKTGADDEAIQSGQNLLLTFTGVRNELGKGNDIFNQTSALAVDMAAALNEGEVSAAGLKGVSLQLGKALNDPVKGITALTRSGVSFTEQQKTQIKAMVKAGDTLGAQKLILAELGKEFGGAAKAASDPMSRLSTIAGNLSEQIGGVLLPAVDAFATFIGTRVVPAVSGFFDSMQSGGGRFAAFRAGVAGFVAAFKSDVLPVLADVWTWIQDKLIPAVAAFAGWLVKNLRPAVTQIGKSLRDDLAPAIRGAIDHFRDAWPSIQKVLGVLKGLAEIILTKVVPAVIALYSAHLKRLIGVLGSIFEVSWKVIGAVVSFGKALADMGHKAIVAIKPLANVYLAFVDGVLSGFETILKGLGHLPKWVGGGKFDDAAAAVGKLRGGIASIKAAINAIPTETEIDFKIHDAEVKAKIRALAKQLAAIPKVTNVYVDVQTRNTLAGSGVGRSLAGGQTRAGGGPVTAGQTYLVGERGPEWLIMGDRGGRVLPNGTAPAAAGGVMVNLGGIVVNGVADVSRARDVASVIGAGVADVLSRNRALAALAGG